MVGGWVGGWAGGRVGWWVHSTTWEGVRGWGSDWQVPAAMAHLATDTRAWQSSLPVADKPLSPRAQPTQIQPACSPMGLPQTAL